MILQLRNNERFSGSVEGSPGWREPTIDSIDLYQILLDRAVIRRFGPGESSSICSDTSKRDIGGFGNVNAEDVDQLGHRFPKGLPRAMQ